MSTVISVSEKEKLYSQILHLLGMPVRGVELTEEQMDSFLEMSVNEYEQYVSDWLIESQWSSLVGLDLDTQSLANAFHTRNMNFEDQFTYSYSKIVGLQSGGPWVLKKDYIELVRGQQMYEIPAGREINELMWFTRAELTDSIVDPFLGGFGGLGGVGFGGVGGFAQVGTSGSYFMLPAFDLLLRMQDRNFKSRMIGGDLTYKITAGPEGKKLVHLYNVPGGKFDFGNAELMKGKVWYWYYDVGPDDRDKCLKNNPEIIKMPSDVPLDKMSWVDLNNPAQQWVRRYFIATCKETLGRVRGKFSGNIKTPDSELTMDYQSLLTEGKDEKMKLIEELTGAEGTLTRLKPDKVMEREALLAENLNKQLKFRAMPRQIYVI